MGKQGGETGVQNPEAEMQAEMHWWQAIVSVQSYILYIIFHILTPRLGEQKAI